VFRRQLIDNTDRWSPSIESRDAEQEHTAAAASAAVKKWLTEIAVEKELDDIVDEDDNCGWWVRRRQVTATIVLRPSVRPSVRSSLSLVQRPQLDWVAPQRRSIECVGRSWPPADIVGITSMLRLWRYGHRLVFSSPRRRLLYFVVHSAVSGIVGRLGARKDDQPLKVVKSYSSNQKGFPCSREGNNYMYVVGSTFRKK